MSKRRRTSSGFSTKRPIDKVLVFITDDGIGLTQVSTTLLTAATACTMVGLRWSMASFKDGGTGGNVSNFEWAIVLVEDGNTANNLGVGNGGSYYDPKQNVLAFGVSPNLQNTQPPLHITGNTKTMRKLRIGDTIRLITKGQNTETSGVRGIIQLFCKS